MQLDRSFNLNKHFDEKYPEVFAKNMMMEQMCNTEKKMCPNPMS